MIIVVMKMILDLNLLICIAGKKIVNEPGRSHPRK
jgi:hypothetical protein